MDSRAVRSFRAFVVATAVVAIVLGIVAVVWPAPSIVLVALVFGVYLVVAGTMRVVAAVRGHGTSAVWRWTAGAVGGLVGVAGLVALLAPAVPLLVYAVLAGVGFLVEGVAALVGAVVGHPGSSRSPTVVSGLLSCIGGVVVLVAPVLALSVFTVFSGIALIGVGAAALLLLPPRAAVRREAVGTGRTDRR
ncbi:HdeD family acid-resistance protein [Curtobacterium sp. 1310]|uniref:HdeD family acid-resistance protein n=1 Tax=Curtobacterium sp. 1310 TaxID=2806570 RepID=UPI001AE164F1|nr:DUF308 domain-containing protein [Curtobacterium sp. 1310]MBP1300231.1 uncharacterized membrane protein HdeD (DUF308 family) [Curtobacterium sp. 1310]